MSERTPERDPLVTVLMGVWNSSRYLDEAIRSIVDQTFEDFTFLIIDDGSSDGSAEIIERWAKWDHRIVPIHHDENRGLTECLATGVEHARTPLVARMDADDVSLPERLEVQVRFLEEHQDIDVLGSWAYEVGERGEVLGERRYPTSHEELVRLLWTNPIIHPTVMFRRDSVRNVGSYARSVQKRQDYDLWFRCVAGGLRLANVPRSLLKYRYTEDYYYRNNWWVAWEQARIGWRGCRRIRANPLQYLGVAIPLARSILSGRMNKRLDSVLTAVDPRRRPPGYSQDSRSRVTAHQ